MLNFVLWFLFLILPTVNSTFFADNFTVPKMVAFYFLAAFGAIFLSVQKRTFYLDKRILICVLALFFLRGLSVLQVPLLPFFYFFSESLLFLVLVLAFSGLPPKTDFLKDSRNPLIFGLLFVLTKAFYEFYECRFVSFNSDFQCFPSSFGNINMLAEYLIFLVPILHYYLNNETEKKWKQISFVFLTFTLVLLFFASSRSTYLSFVICFGLLVLFKKVSRLDWSVLGATVFVVLVIDLMTPPQPSSAYLKDHSNSRRRTLYEASALMTLENPRGIGPGQFDFALIPYRLATSEPAREDILDETPHNEFLKWSLSYGWAYGLVALMMVIFIFLLLRGDSIGTKKKIPLYGIFLFFLVQMCFQFPFENAFSLAFAAWALAFLWRESSPFANGIAIRIPRFVFILLILLTTSLAGVYTYSRYWELQGVQSSEVSKQICSLYSVSWRACVSEIKNLVEEKRYEEAIQAANKELRAHPFNFFALRYSAEALKNIGRPEKACERMQIYEILFAGQGSLAEEVQSCEIPLSFNYESPSQFKKAYQNWLQATQK